MIVIELNYLDKKGAACQMRRELRPGDNKDVMELFAAKLQSLAKQRLAASLYRDKDQLIGEVGYHQGNKYIWWYDPDGFKLALTQSHLD